LGRNNQLRTNRIHMTVTGTYLMSHVKSYKISRYDIFFLYTFLFFYFFIYYYYHLFISLLIILSINNQAVALAVRSRVPEKGIVSGMILSYRNILN
jgi:hypothetical protein